MIQGFRVPHNKYFNTIYKPLRLLLRNNSALVLFLYLSAASTTASMTPGVVPVSLNVSPQGQAQVEFPIHLPAEASNVAPSLALSYRENYFSPILGRAFSLSGFSVIHRCQSTIEDGKGNSSSLEPAQADYCLDGMLLKQVSENSSKYYKRVNDNSVIEHDGDSVNPGTWSLLTSNGLEYVYTKESTTQGHSIVDAAASDRWLLTNINKKNTADDSNQNVSITYHKNSYFIKPSIMKYGDINVIFNYEDTNTSIQSYRNGASFTDSQRLSSIEIKRSTNVLVNHTLNYESAGTGVSYRLQSVSSCFNDNKSCVEPSYVEYEIQDNIDDVKLSSQLIYEKSSSTSISLPNLGSYTVGDIDGDGITDFCTYSTEDRGILCGNSRKGFSLRSNASDDPIVLADISKFYGSSSTNSSEYDEQLKEYITDIQGINSLKLIDLNNDGFDDYCLSKPYINRYGKRSAYKFNCAINNKNGYFLPQYETTIEYYHLPNPSYYYQKGIPFSQSYVDTNKDGYVDVCIEQMEIVEGRNNGSHRKNQWCYLNDKNGRFNSANKFQILKHYKTASLKVDDSWPSKLGAQFIDLNGDYSPEYCYPIAGKLSCKSSTTIQGSDQEIIYSLVGVDRNDKAIPSTSDIEIDISAITGKSGINLKEIYKTINFVDINRDRTPDLCYIENQQPVCYLNDGAGAFSDKASFNSINILADVYENIGNYSEDTIAMLIRSLQYHDVDSDGFVDICWVNSASYMCALGHEVGFNSAVEIIPLELSTEVTVKLDSIGGKKDTLVDKIGNSFKKKENRETKYFLKDEGKLAFGPVRLIKDSNGDGRNELCYRSDQGITCNDVGRSNLHRINAIVNSFGLRKAVRYQSTLSSSVYSVENNIAEELATSDSRKRLINPVKEVVTRLSVDNGQYNISNDFTSIGMNESNFKYSNFSRNLDGYSAGFLNVEETNTASNIRLKQKFYNNSMLIGKAFSIEKFDVSGSEEKLEERNTFDYAVHGAYQRLSSKKHEKLEGENIYLNQIITYSDFDAYNFPKSVINVKEGFDSSSVSQNKRTITKDIKYDHKLSLRLLGLIKQELITIDSGNADQVLKPATISIFNEYGYLTSQTKTIHSGDGVDTNYAGKLVTTYEDFTKFGQAKTITRTGRSGVQADSKEESRVNKKTFKANGLISSETNPLNHVVSYKYEGEGQRCQKPSKVIDVNERETSFGYDDLCRKNKVSSFDGSVVSKHWKADDSLNRGLTKFGGLYLNTPSVYSVSEIKQTSEQVLGAYSLSQKISYYDRFERPLREILIGERNQDSAVCSVGSKVEDTFIDYAYDQLGRTAGQTLPYGGCFEQESSLNTQVWQASIFDGRGRVTSSIKQADDDGADIVTSYAHSANKLVQTFDGAVEKTIISSIYGEPLSIQKSGSHTLLFERNGMGLVTNVTRGDLKTTISYDDFGNKITMKDPDMGSWSYGYNAFGELVRQTDAKKKVTTLTYDKLGRLTNKSFLNGSWTWKYDPTEGDKTERGVLDYHQAKKNNNTITKSLFKYNDLGLVKSENLTVGDKKFNTSFLYDDANRIEKEMQASGVTLYRDYDVMGRLMQVSVPKGSVKGYNLDVLDSAIELVNSAVDELQEKVKINLEKAKIYAKKAKVLQEKALTLSTISTVDLQTLERLNQAAHAASRTRNYYESKMNFAQAQLTLMKKRSMDHFVAIAKDNGSNILLHHTKPWRRKETNGKKNGEYKDAKDVKLLDTGTSQGKEALAKAGVRGNQCYRDFKRNRWGRWIGRNHCSKGIHPVNYYTHLYSGYRAVYNAKQAIYATNEQQYKVKKSAIEKRLQESNTAMAQAKSSYDEWRKASLKFQGQQETLAAVLGTQKELTSLVANLKADDKTKVILWAATRYRPDGQLQSEVFGNGYTTQRTVYPYSGRIRNITTAFAGKNNIRDLEYTYNRRGNLSNKTGNVLATSEDYLYEDENSPDRLTSWTWSQTGNDSLKPVSQVYAYNKFGGMNITQIGLKSEPLVFDSVSQRVEKVTKLGPDSKGEASYQYDKNGNLENKNGLEITWNAFNKPESIISNSSKTTFSYRASGERVQKLVAVNGGTQTTTYVNPGLELIENSMGKTLWRQHIKVGNDVVATIEKDAAKESPEADKVAFMHRDLLGNPDTITDIHGNIMKVSSDKDAPKNVKSSHRLYSPYGKLMGYISETEEALSTVKVGASPDNSYRSSFEEKSKTLDEIEELAGQLRLDLEVPDQQYEIDVDKYGELSAINLETSGIQSGLTTAANNINAANTKIEGERTRKCRNHRFFGRRCYYRSSGEALEAQRNGKQSKAAKANGQLNPSARGPNGSPIKRTYSKLEFTPAKQAKYQGTIAGGLKGFTSHETLEEHGLVHMNARIYDPEHGIFLSADTIIPDPNDWDAYNRYMYVQGNPMRYRDPSGHNGIPLDTSEMSDASVGVTSDDITNTGRMGYNGTAELNNFSTQTGGTNANGVVVSVSAGGTGSSSFDFDYSDLNNDDSYTWNDFVSTWPMPSQGVTDFAAGFGDTLSFGLTSGIRSLMGINGGVDEGSGEYGGGVSSALVLSLSFGVSHLGRNMLMQTGKTGGMALGAKRLIFDPRKWGTVRSMWSLTAGRGVASLKRKGQQLHHWFRPQSLGGSNAGYNYLPVSNFTNRVMGNGRQTFTQFMTFNTFRFSVLGIYGAAPTAVVRD